MAKVVRLRRDGDSEEQPSKLSAHDARRIVQSMARDSSRVFVVPHAKARQRKHGVTMRQIMNCLRKGVVTEGPFVNVHGNWQVNMSRLAAGYEVTCTVAIEWGQQLIVVTVYPG